MRLFCLTVSVLALVSRSSMAAPISPADLLAASPATDWRAVDPENTLYVDLPAGRVVIELAPRFAPANVAAIKRLVRSGYLARAVVMRAQAGYVVQWGPPEDNRPKPEPPKVKAEFETRAAVPFQVLPDPDAYAPQVGLSDGFPAARDPASGLTWLAHCPAMVGVARDMDADSGDGADLYSVTGHAPRHLDRNITLVGRVVQGQELLLAMPLGTGDLGFYKTAGEQTRILGVHVAADLPAAQQVRLEALRTDSATWAALFDGRRNRREAWFKVPSGHVDLCNTPLPVRVAP